MPTAALSPIAVPTAGVPTAAASRGAFRAVGSSRGAVAEQSLFLLRLLLRLLLLLGERETFPASAGTAPAACSVAVATIDNVDMLTRVNKRGSSLKLNN